MVALLLAGLALAAPGTRAKGVVESQSTAEALNQALAPRKIALLVGIDIYEDRAFSPLEHAASDARALGEVFEDKKSGGFDEVRVVASHSATRTSVLQALRRLSAELHPNDELVLYFSGHGTRLPDGDRWRRFLVATDTRASDLEGTGLDLDALQKYFSSLPPSRKALIVDACFNGDGKSVLRPSDRNAEIAAPLSPTAAGLGLGEAHLFATSPGRPALEDDQLGHGVYTHYLLESLSWSFGEADRDTDGVVTAWEAHDFARQRTIDHTNGVQVPEAALRIVGSADVVLGGSQLQRQKKDKALVYLYASENHPLSGSTVTIDGRARGGLPGTVPVTAGRHQFTLQDEQGEVLADGFLTVSPGRSIRAEELTRLLRGPRRGVGVRSAIVWSAPFSESFDGPAVGAELFTYSRKDTAPSRGFYLGGHLPLLTGSRQTTQGNSSRWLTAPGIEAGVQKDFRRLRGRAAATASFVVMPRNWPEGRPDPAPEDPYTVASHAGWLFGTVGATAHAGVVVSETWSLGVTVRPSFTALDLDGDGRAALIPWTVGSAGVEATF